HGRVNSDWTRPPHRSQAGGDKSRWLGDPRAPPDIHPRSVQWREREVLLRGSIRREHPPRRCPQLEPARIQHKAGGAVLEPGDDAQDGRSDQGGHGPPRPPPDVRVPGSSHDQGDDPGRWSAPQPGTARRWPGVEPPQDHRTAQPGWGLSERCPLTWPPPRPTGRPALVLAGRPWIPCLAGLLSAGGRVCFEPRACGRVKQGGPAPSDGLHVGSVMQEVRGDPDRWRDPDRSREYGEGNSPGATDVSPKPATAPWDCEEGNSRPTGFTSKDKSGGYGSFPHDPDQPADRPSRRIREPRRRGCR